MSQADFLGNGWLERGVLFGKFPGVFLSDSSIVPVSLRGKKRRGGKAPPFACVYTRAHGTNPRFFKLVDHRIRGIRVKITNTYESVATKATNSAEKFGLYGISET